MSFKEIFCQDKAINILQRAFTSGKWAHAYIFAGPEGVGKFKTAHEWAKLLLCKYPVINNDFADSCGSCQACRLFEADSHPDFNHIYKELREFTKDGKGKPPPVDLPIDVIREFLIEKVSTKPTLSQRKVFIVSEAERLNAYSQNALLKVLEEPPKYCSIILLCTRLEKLLPTTKSRSQIIRFGPIAEEQIIEKLQQIDLAEKPARYFGRLAQGSLGAACQWAKLELADAKLYETKKEIVRVLADYEIADALSLAEKFLGKSKEIATVWSDLDKATSKTDINRRASKTLVRIIISALYDSMNLDITPTPLEIPGRPRHLPGKSRPKKRKFLTGPTKEAINFDQEEHIKKLAGRFDAEQSAEKISDCYKVLRWIESSVNEKLIFEQLLLNLADSDRIKV